MAISVFWAISHTKHCSTVIYSDHVVEYKQSRRSLIVFYTGYNQSVVKHTMFRGFRFVNYNQPVLGAIPFKNGGRVDGVLKYHIVGEGFGKYIISVGGLENPIFLYEGENHIFL